LAARAVARFGGRAAAPGTAAPPGTAAVVANDADQQQGKSLIGQFAYSMAMNIDDVAIIALKDVVAKHPEWFAAMAKTAPAGRLAKFNETESRDDKGRWSAAGAATVGAVAAAGAAAGAAGTGWGVRVARRRAFGRAKAAVAPVLTARKTVATRLAERGFRRQAAAANIERGLRRPASTFVPTAIRGLSSRARRADAELSAHMGEHAEPFWPDPESDTPVWASTDATGEAAIRDHAQTLREQIIDLKANGRPTRTVRVKGSITTPKKDSVQQTRKGRGFFVWRDFDADGAPAPRRKGRTSVWEYEMDFDANAGAPAPRRKGRSQAARAAAEAARAAAKAARAAAKEQPSAAGHAGVQQVLDEVHALGEGQGVPKTTAELESVLRGIPQKYWDRYLQDLNISVTVPRFVRPIKKVTYKNTSRVIPDHRKTIEGYPNKAGRKTLADQIRDDIARRTADAAERDRSAAWATEPIAQARTAARSSGGVAAMRRLALLRVKGRTAIVGAGVLGALTAGGAAYAFLRGRKSSQLGKAFNPDQTRDARGRWSAATKHQPTVTVLIGAPASGKTTWRLANRPHATLISTDAVLAREGKATTPANIDAALKVARREFHAAAAAGHDIVLDRTNPTAKSRGRWLSLLPPGYRKEAVVFETHGLERAYRMDQRRAAGTWVDDPRLRFAVPVERPAAGEFDHVETVKQGVTNHAIAWARDRKSGRLAKAAPDDDPEQARTVYDAGASVESTLADKLARTFGRWTQIPADQLAEGSNMLRDGFQADVVRATSPLDAAARGGAGADIDVQTTDDTGRNRIITMALDAGSPKVRAFSQAYRVKLAGDMADEQLATVQSVLQDATLQGQAPEVTARILRQTIGLTPYQASHVVSFRRQLETLDPNVLDRALRDRRYDATVNRAILEGNPLNDGQVDAMTAAYHRRYLAYRAMTIARTEGLRAANNGHAVAIEGFTDEHPGFSVIKTWMATEDDRTRPDHRSLHGQQVVGLHTPFVVPENGDTLLWPHDPEAPLRQQVNCRCTFTTSLVPRTSVAQRGFALVADQPRGEALV
jgi:hypothetical protein